MASFFAQKYRDLYKVHNGADGATASGRRHQAERRSQLLTQQKQLRQDAVDEARGLVHAIEHYSLPNYASNRLPYRVDRVYRNKLQLSEWLRDRPDDLDQWVLVPCPRGKRHIVVAAANKTIAYSKTGVVIDIFQSSLQSGSRYLTVLDCIFSEETQAFYVLDVLVYHNQEFLLCDAAFRFYWIRAKFDEIDHSAVHAHNRYAFHHVDRADFDRPEEVEGLLARHPLWEENAPALDGFLLYHKLSHYHHGKTPLVGWLCPWMVPEVLGYAVHAQYAKERPKDAASALDYMREFDEKRRGQRRRHFFTQQQQQQQRKKAAGEGEASWAQKMDVAEAPQLTVELDDVDLREEDGDGTEELEDDDLDEEELELGLDVERELVDEMLGGGGRGGDEDDLGMELLEKKHRGRRSGNQDQKCISTTVFRF